MKIILLIVCLAIGETISARLERSIGGWRARITEASFFASIKKNGIYKCGGALITGRHVLTAAVCIVDTSGRKDFNNRVITGTDKKYSGGIEYQIEDLMILKETFNNDHQFALAVAVLHGDVSRSLEDHFIKALPIGQPSFDNAIAYFFAFESTENPLINTDLHELPLQPHPDYEYEEFGDSVADTVYVFRAYHGSGRTFQADTGGPLVSNGSLVGIATPMSTVADNSRVFTWVYKFKNILKKQFPDVEILD